MPTRRILVLADDAAEGEKLAMDLTKAGYAAPSADFRDLPHLILPQPDLAVVCFSPWMEEAIDLAQVAKEMTEVPLLVISALGLSHRSGPLRVHPAVRGVLFRPYTRAALLESVESALAVPAAKPPGSVRVDAIGGAGREFRRDPPRSGRRRRRVRQPVR